MTRPFEIKTRFCYVLQKDATCTVAQRAAIRTVGKDAGILDERSHTYAAGYGITKKL